MSISQVYDSLIHPIILGSGPYRVTIAQPVILAPMSGVSDMPFRRLARELGAGLVVSEMIASWAMVRENAKTLQMAEIVAGRGPSSLQLAGSDPATGRLPDLRRRRQALRNPLMRLHKAKAHPMRGHRTH